jgi:cytochrome bd ubiquinol oxidase subunit II
MGLPDVMAAVMLGALVAYAVTGGADFGGGLWDLIATGPRAARQRDLVEHALAPVWEANHVWLIFVLVVLFTAFPPAYAALTTALHVPLTLMLVGIVLRGSAFVFRQYGGGAAPVAHRWGRVFAVASVVTPFFLGAVLAALTEGRIAVDLARPEATALSWRWAAPFALLVGGFTLALFGYLAAVYLTVEAADPDLREDFRRRAFVSGAVVGAFALASAVCARAEAPAFFARLIGSPWSWPLQIATGAAAVAGFHALYRRHFRRARALAATQVALIVVGWGAAQYPLLIAPDLGIARAAAPPITLRLLVPVLLAGGLVLLPSLYYLMRVFKRRPQ